MLQFPRPIQGRPPPFFTIKKKMKVRVQLVYMTLLYIFCSLFFDQCITIWQYLEVPPQDNRMTFLLVNKMLHRTGCCHMLSLCMFFECIYAAVVTKLLRQLEHFICMKESIQLSEWDTFQFGPNVMNVSTFSCTAPLHIVQWTNSFILEGRRDNFSNCE